MTKNKKPKQPVSTRRKKWTRRGLISAIGITLGVSLFLSTHPNEEEQAQLKLQKNLEHRVLIAKGLAEPLRKKQFPENLNLMWNGFPQTLKVEYTLEPHLQKEADRLLTLYKPDYGAIVLMDADNGKILAMSSFQKRAEIDEENLNLRASYPAASVFKVVTATAAIDKAGISPSHTIYFNGGNYTLYRKNVMSDKINRWTRAITLKEAFARSINTAFGRLSLENLSPEDINNYANRYMFNQDIPSDFPIEMGVAFVPSEKSFALTEVASGFNKLNRMSPVQGAMISASVINGGRMVMPYLVESLTSENNTKVYQASVIDNGQIMSGESADKLKELMEETILSGTSRKTFRNLVRNRKFKEIEMGGKTGHLTGTNPKGRVDWFVGYASDENKKISVAAITINQKYWTVKSSYLGQSMFKKYFEPVLQQRRMAAQE